MVGVKSLLVNTSNPWCGVVPVNSGHFCTDSCVFCSSPSTSHPRSRELLAARRDHVRAQELVDGVEVPRAREERRLIGRPTSASVRPDWFAQARNTVLPVLVAFSAKKKIDVDRIVARGDNRSTADT